MKCIDLLEHLDGHYVKEALNKYLISKYERQLISLDRENFQKYFTYIEKAIEILDGRGKGYCITTHWLTYIFEKIVSGIWGDFYPCFYLVAWSLGRENGVFKVKECKKEVKTYKPNGEIVFGKNEESVVLRVPDYANNKIAINFLCKSIRLFKRTTEILRKYFEGSVPYYLSTILDISKSNINENNFIQMIAAALHLLTYDENSEDSKKLEQGRVDEINIYDYARREGFLYDAKSTLPTYIQGDKRLWAAIKDYFLDYGLGYALKIAARKGSILERYMEEYLEYSKEIVRHNGEPVRKSKRYTIGESFLCQLELPGDRHNQRFLMALLENLNANLQVRLYQEFNRRQAKILTIINPIFSTGEESEAPRLNARRLYILLRGIARSYVDDYGLYPIFLNYSYALASSHKITKRNEGKFWRTVFEYFRGEKHSARDVFNIDVSENINRKLEQKLQKFKEESSKGQ